MNNAGVGHLRGWEEVVAVNAIGVLTGSYLALERMKSKGGNVINTASLAGFLKADQMDTACYFISKHAVIALTRSLGQFGGDGIRFNALAPSYVNTDLIKPHFDLVKDHVGVENILSVDEVTSAFMTLVKASIFSKKSGAVLCVLPHSMPFYWPDFPFQDRVPVAWLTVGAFLANKILPKSLFPAFSTWMLILWTVISLFIFNFTLSIVFRLIW